VLDDADGILYDEDGLNVLKAALDTKPVRKIHWGTNSIILEKEGVPSNFEFKGAVIFLTNIKWDQSRSARISNHLEAIMSRTHYLDLRIDTLRERAIHISNVVDTTDMLWEYNFTKAEIDDLMAWIMSNITKLKNFDLRTVIKASDLMKAMPRNWKTRAAKTLFKAKS
jgi:hypothetical protein